MDLNTLANLVTTIAVVLGVGFGLVELRRAGRDRRDRAAVEVVRSVQTQDIQRAVGIVMNLPDDADPDLIRRDPDLRDAAMLVYFACEMFGSFVFEGVVELHTLDRMVGGWVRSTWRRLRPWIEAEREENRNVNEGEWWQWLIGQLDANPDPGKSLGAHVAYREWRAGVRPETLNTASARSEPIRSPTAAPSKASTGGQPAPSAQRKTRRRRRSAPDAG